MPVGKIWNAEWLNQNSQRNYPIAEGASLKDVTGTFTIPTDFIVDLVWPVQASAPVQADRFYVHALTVFSEGVTITLGYHIVGNPAGSPIGSVSVVTTTHTRNQSYFINGSGDFYDSIGKITIGSIENILSAGGLYSFNLAGARLETTVVRPNLRGVSAVILTNSNDRSDPISGDIELVAGTNIRLIANANPGGNPQIRIDAISGVGLNQSCDCSGQLPEDAVPIRTINGIPPDEAGNFELIGDECLVLEAMTNGLAINDECSQACCGCQELDKIITDLQTMQAQINTLEGYAARLEASVNTALTNLIASKSSNLPCS